MCHGAGIFRKLQTAQGTHIVNTFYRAPSLAAEHVSRKFLVTKNRQPFFQRQLKPVTAGHAVASPVMKIFMTHDGFNVGIVGVSGNRGVGQYIFGIEDIQPFVFHGPHVEIADRDYHEPVKIEFQTKALLVPLNGMNERLHGMVCLVQIARLHPYLQQHFTPRLRRQRSFLTYELTRYQGEQITRLGKGVFPAGVVPSLVEFALLHQIAVRQ